MTESAYWLPWIGRLEKGNPQERDQVAGQFRSAGEDATAAFPALEALIMRVPLNQGLAMVNILAEGRFAAAVRSLCRVAESESPNEVRYYALKRASEHPLRDPAVFEMLISWVETRNVEDGKVALKAIARFFDPQNPLPFPGIDRAALQALNFLPPLNELGQALNESRSSAALQAAQSLPSLVYGWLMGSIAEGSESGIACFAAMSRPLRQKLLSAMEAPNSGFSNRTWADDHPQAAAFVKAALSASAKEVHQIAAPLKNPQK